MLQQTHTREMGAIEKRYRASTGNEQQKIIEQREIMIQRGRLLTMGNLIRVSLAHGAANVALMKDAQIFKHLAENAIPRGRPKVAV